jgi:hypothetical protein
MVLRARMVTMRVRILNLFSKPLCVSSCHVMTLHLPGVTREESSLMRRLMRRRIRRNRRRLNCLRRKVRVMKLVMPVMPVTPLIPLLMIPSQGVSSLRVVWDTRH